MHSRHPLEVVPVPVASAQERVEGVAVGTGSELVVARTARQMLCPLTSACVVCPRTTSQHGCWVGRFSRATYCERFNVVHREAVR